MFIRDRVIKHPIISFIILTFFISYFLGIPLNMWLSRLLEGDGPITRTYLPRALTVYGPFLAAIIVTGFTKGEVAIHGLLRKLLPHRRHFLWCILPVLIAWCLTLLAYWMGGLAPDSFLALFKAFPGLFIMHLLAQFLIVGIGEETGWRGWLLPAFLHRYTLPKSVALVAVIWGIWHFPVIFSGMELFLPWLVILLSMSVILAWLWVKTDGNIVVVALAHAGANAPQFFIESQLTGPENQLILIRSWQYLAFLFLVPGILTGILLFRKSRRL